jgi:hypothetical protein
MMGRWPGVTGAALVAALAGYAALQVAGRTSGSTRAERARSLPGDDLVAGPRLVTNHARLLGAPPEEIWPWLTQMGWHRAGWYTPRWVDELLFPDNWPSADRLDAALVRRLRVGDTIPDGRPGTAFFVVEHVDPPRSLVLRSRTHVPPGWADRFGASLDWIWTFQCDPVGDRRARLQIRNQGTVRPRWLDLGYQALIVPADHVMARGMLRGLDERVTSAAARA